MYGGGVTFYPAGVSNLNLDTETHGMSNHVYVYKSPDGSFQLLASQYSSGGALCYGDMAAIKIVSGHNVGQTMNAKNVEDYVAWQGETVFPVDEIVDLLQAIESAAQSCEQDGVTAWFKCVFQSINQIFTGLAAATSVKQYLYQFPIIVRPGQWTGLSAGGTVNTGDTVQFMTLKTSITTQEMDLAIGTYWLLLVVLSYIRSGESATLLKRYQSLKDDRGLPLPGPQDISALALLDIIDSDAYQTLTGTPSVFSFQTSDSDDKKGWLRQKDLGDDDMIQSFVVST